MLENDILVNITSLAGRVLAVVAAMPTEEAIEGHIDDAQAAQERGYFLPDEDDRLRAVYMRYLSVRSELLDVVSEVQALSCNAALSSQSKLSLFSVGYSAAVVLVRSARFIVSLAEGRLVVHGKLDEAAPLYGLDKGSFSVVYGNLTSPRKMWRFYEATKYYEKHKEDIYSILGVELEGVKELLIEEEEFIWFSKSEYVKSRLRYRVHSFRRKKALGYKNAMFHLFKLSGSMIAEMRQPLVKRLTYGEKAKRVSSDVLKEIRDVLRVGDVLVTRHDDALSNLFLPGFWPHAALYIGASARGEDCRNDTYACVLEARKDGVLYRDLEDTLSVDSFVVLRPNLDTTDVETAMLSALSHEGKRYDFLFDFSQADRLACTELIYRSYHGVGGVDLALEERVGRKCLSAEELMNQLLGSGKFDLVALYGVKGKRILSGDLAWRVLQSSYEMKLPVKYDKNGKKT